MLFLVLGFSSCNVTSLAVTLLLAWTGWVSICWVLVEWNQDVSLGEALVLTLAISLVRSSGWDSCLCVDDCQHLIRALNNEEPDWIPKNSCEDIWGLSDTMQQAAF